MENNTEKIIQLSQLVDISCNFEQIESPRQIKFSLLSNGLPEKYTEDNHHCNMKNLKKKRDFSCF